ncbi:GSCOCG00007354001-RA-CDS [Cotesia congregata]|nr:GSCOCG00007354001-RA-CDS [Cotesia congregata]
MLNVSGELMDQFPGRIITAELPKLPRPEIGVKNPHEIFGRQSIFHPVFEKQKQSMSVQETMMRIQKKVLERRLRVREFFQHFDVFNSGRLTNSQFHRGLDSLLKSSGGFYLSENEIKNLIIQYSDPNDPSRVLWRVFEDDVNHVFTINELEKLPLLQVNFPPLEIEELPERGAKNWQVVSSEARDLCEETLMKIRRKIQHRQIYLKQFFNDYDKLNHGYVSRNQLRQVLTVATILVSPEEIFALEQRYNDELGFNYAYFLKDLDSKIVEAPLYGKMLEEMKHLNLESPKTDPSVDDKDIVQIIAKIKAKVVRERIMVLEFFRQHDPRNEQVITRSNFIRSLDQLKCNLNLYELDTLIDHFKSPLRPDYVDYVRFSNTIEEAITIGFLEKSPLLFPLQHIPSESCPKSFLNYEERLVIARVLDRLITEYNPNLEDLFKDFDKCNSGTVDKEQLIKVLSVRNLLHLLNPRELNTLYKCFIVKFPNLANRDVNLSDLRYRDFELTPIDLTQPKMINIAGVVSIGLFYVLILGVGIWAARKKEAGNDSEEEVMLAGRSIGLFVGIFTMTATWVGGGYINGTAEMVYTRGLVWCQAPFGYALSLVFGGIFFANKMRQQGYITMLDPLQDAFGERMGGLLFLPALCGEVFWAAGILAALGATIAVIIDMKHSHSIIFSACIAVFYTLFGGLYAVAYTDVIQLFCIFIGLWMCIPFAWMNPLVQPLDSLDVDWIGNVPSEEYWSYLDYGLLLIFGGIPWQVYFQRVLSSKTAGRAQLLSYVAAAGCILMAIPPVMIGAIAKGTPWNETGYRGPYPLGPGETSMILPMVLQYLTPDFVSFFGLGAVSAAVMSSADSSILSASSMFARNVYKLIFRQRASEMEIIWVMRVGIAIVGVLSTIMALTIPSIYGLWSMCSDLVYVILFPQLLMVVHFKDYCNTYGSLAAYIIAFVVRLSGGEAMLGLPALIHFPGYDEVNQVQMFPFRTMAMLISLITLIGVSWGTQYVFLTGKLAPGYDVFRCVVNIPEDVERVGPDPAEGEQMAVLAAGMGKLYGSKDESNGRVNPALEPDYDMELEPNSQLIAANGGGTSGGGGGASGGHTVPHHTNIRQLQSNTAL